MPEIDFISPLHTKTQRDYVQRVVEFDKAACAEIAKQWGYDYWDGERQFGFGGYRYDGRWRPVAEKIVEHYNLNADSRVLDVGCGKAFLLYEITQAVPGIEVAGIDISQYAIENSKEEVRPFLKLGSATVLPWPNQYFDLVFTINTFHNLLNFDLMAALKEMQRVGRKDRYVCVESYRNEAEKANLLYWQLTCETFYRPDEWLWFYEQAGFEGDYSFIYFE